MAVRLCGPRKSPALPLLARRQGVEGPSSGDALEERQARVGADGREVQCERGAREVHDPVVDVQGGSGEGGGEGCAGV